MCLSDCINSNQFEPRCLCKSCANGVYLCDVENTNVTITLDKRRKKSDGSYPLLMRLGHNARTIPMPLGISLREKDWDETTKTVKGSFKDVSNITRLNNQIQKKKSEALDKILKLHESGKLQSLTIQELKRRIIGADHKTSFFDYAEEQIVQLIAAERIGTARSYKGLVAVLRTFNKKQDLRFSQVDYSFLLRFENNHFGKGNGHNGLAVYMRTIRAIYNKAIKEGLVDKTLYPFEDYKIRTKDTQKRALTLEQLRAIVNLKLTENDPLFHTRNYFLCSLMLYGMNFMDMAHLKKSAIQNDRLIYQRKKTDKVYDILLPFQVKAIFSYYGNSSTEYVFPIIKRANALGREKDIQWARKRYNKSLKLLAARCGIEKSVTSYVSRHSFASIANNSRIPVKAISEMLGHSSVRTTEIYIDSLPKQVLDDYNNSLLALFTSTAAI